jgi:Glutamyl-tRNAGlu reductase, dimerisation domain
MRLGQDSAEQIRRHEVSRALKQIDLSTEEEEVIELLSHSLVGKLLHGPISRVMARAEVEISSEDRRGAEASSGLKAYEDGPPGSKIDHQIGQSGKPYITREFGIRSD